MRKFVKKSFSIFMCLLLALAISGEYGAIQAHAVDSETVISFTVGEGGSVQYKIESEGTWTDAADILNTSISNGAVVYLKAAPDSGKQLDTHDNQQNIRFNDTDNYIGSASFGALLDGSYSFTYSASYHYNITIKFDGAGTPGGGGGGAPADPGKYTVLVDQQVSGRTGKVKIEYLNSSGSSLGSAEYTADESNAVSFPEGTESVKVTIPEGEDILNNIRLENRDTRDEADLIDDIRDHHYATEPINMSNGYQLRVYFSNTMSVSWSYDPSAAWDQYVEHATIELLRSDDPTDLWDPGRTDWQLTAGETYYFLLVPEYGYQIVGLNINGQPIQPKDAVGVFEFEMIHSNFHFQGIVSEFADMAEIVPDGLIGGMEVDANGAVDSGNALVTETEVANDYSAVRAVGDSSAGMVGTIDLSLKQVISRGDDTFWETEMEEVANPVNLSIVLPAGELADGQTYSIVRNHNGVYEELEAVYNSDTECLEFATDKFSEYTIITKSGTPATGIPDDDSGDDYTAPATPAVINTPVAATLSDGTKIESWNDVSTVLKAKGVATKNELLQLTINPSDATVPANTFEALSKSNSSGLHFFTGKGTALTFANDKNAKKQQAIDLSAESTEAAGIKTVTFKSFDKLQASVLMHSVVPTGTKQVVVYYTGKDGERKALYILEPNELGRFCFPVSQLGKFEFVY